MGSMNYPIFTGKEFPEDWLADYELFMLLMQVVNDEEKLRAIPLVLRGEAKTWLNGLGSSSSSGLGSISPSLSCAVQAKDFGC